MSRLRAFVIVLVVVVWGMCVPVTMAASHCEMMAIACDVACAATPTVSAPAAPVGVEPAPRTAESPALAPPAPDLFVLEPPPKSPALSV